MADGLAPCSPAAAGSRTGPTTTCASWSRTTRRARSLVAGLRRRGGDFFTETLPVAPDWPDALCGFLRLSPGYDSAARVARLRGWPCVLGPDDRPGGHFAALVDPDAVADDLETLLALL